MRVIYEILNDICDLVKDDLSSEKLKELLILINEYDTSARSDIINFMRRDGT